MFERHLQDQVHERAVVIATLHFLIVEHAYDQPAVEVSVKNDVPLLVRLQLGHKQGLELLNEAQQAHDELA